MLLGCAAIPWHAGAGLAFVKLSGSGAFARRLCVRVEIIGVYAFSLRMFFSGLGDYMLVLVHFGSLSYT